MRKGEGIKLLSAFFAVGATVFGVAEWISDEKEYEKREAQLLRHEQMVKKLSERSVQDGKR